MDKRNQEQRNEALELARLAGSSFPSDLLKTVMGTELGVLSLLDSNALIEDERNGWLKWSKEFTVLSSSGVNPQRERELYSKLAEAAEALRLPEDLVASYFTGADNSKQARRYWIRAAEKACDRKAYGQALGFLKNSLAVWPWTEAPADRVRIMKESSRCAVVSGDLDYARWTWEELLAFARDRRLVELQVEGLGQLGELSDDAVQVMTCLREAAELAEANFAPERAVRIMLEYVDHLASRVRISPARKIIVRVSKIAEQSESPELISEVLGWEGLILAMSGEHEAASDRIEKSLRLALDNDLPELAALAYRRRANIAEYCSDYSGEIEAHRAAIRYCQETQTGDQMTCISCLAYACFRTGDWKEALDSAKSVIADPKANLTLKAIAKCVEGLIAAFRGERKLAEKLLSESLKQLRLNGLLGLEFYVLLGQAYLRILSGQSAAATKLFDEVRALWRETDDVHDVIPALLFAGGHYAKQGHAERLADCIDILMTTQKSNPLDEARATIVALKAEQTFLQGRKDGFVVALLEASQLFEKIGLPLEQSWTGISAATARVSDETTHAAITVAKRLGLRPFLAILPVGHVEGDSKGEIPCDLTPRQIEVLSFLADGLTSKEIADRLSRSTRTIEMHVGRLLERMNCRTRSEAVRQAVERGWV